MKTLKVTRNKSLEWSLGIHFGILMLGFIPLMHKINTPPTVEYLVEIGYEEFPEIKDAGSEGLKAMSPIFNEEP